LEQSGQTVAPNLKLRRLWTARKNRSPYNVPAAVECAIKDMFTKGIQKTAARVAADAARNYIRESIIPRNWDERTRLDVEKVKAKFKALKVAHDKELARAKAALDARGDDAAGNDHPTGEDIIDTLADEGISPTILLLWIRRR
jgi:L-alanine-DL-glutamate epimerase-like enolase superfamily enzyme